MASWFSCKPCVGSDPTQDTVKVDIRECEKPDKENVQPVQLANKSEDAKEDVKEKKLAEERRKQAEEEAKRRKEEEAAAEAQRVRERMNKAAEKLAEEKARREAEEKAEAERKVQQEAAAEAAAAEEERLGRLCREALQAQQAADEEARRQREAEELAAAKERVSQWCKKNSFRDMNTQKKTVRGATKFPLHTAVKHKDEEIVRLLLKCGVDQNVKDSKKQTPGELAATLNKNGSHEKLIGLLH